MICLYYVISCDFDEYLPSLVVATFLHPEVVNLELVLLLNVLMVHLLRDEHWTNVDTNMADRETDH